MMRPDDAGEKPKPTGKKHHHERQSWPDPRQTKSPPRSWTNKSMHHPATRIGEIRHGK